MDQSNGGPTTFKKLTTVSPAKGEGGHRMALICTGCMNSIRAKDIGNALMCTGSSYGYLWCKCYGIDRCLCLGKAGLTGRGRLGLGLVS